MVKKVTAPKTYNPGGNRPREYLAYLNQREMDYLRALNSGYMERGPKGLPSFAEESVAGPGGNKGAGSGGGSSGSSAASSGAGGQEKSPSGSQSTTSTQPKGLDSSQTMMTDANGVSYDYNGNVIKSETGPKKSSSIASPNFPSSVNLDRQIQNQTQIKDAIQAVKNTPAIKTSAASGGIKSISVGPMGTPVSVGGTQKTSSPVSKVPDAKIGMSAPRGFYDGITSQQESMLREAQKQSERVSSGLFGRSVGDPRGTVSVPSRTAVSSGVTPGERQAAWDAINPSKIASNIYKDPAGALSRTASGISSGIQSLGNYMGDVYSTIGRGAFSADPMEMEAAGQAAAEAALNYGLLSGTVSMAVPRPTNSLGSLVVGRATTDKAIRNQFDAYDRAVQRGASPESAFYESQKYAPSYAGGVVDLVSDIPKSPNMPIKYAQGVEISEPFELKSSGVLGNVVESVLGKGPLKGVSRYDEVFKRGPIDQSYPEIGNMPVFKDPREPTFDPAKGGVLGSFTPSDYVAKGLEGIATPGEAYNARKYGSMALQANQKRDWAGKIANTPDYFRQTAAHEGLHRVSDVDLNRGISSPIPQGSSPDREIRLIENAISQSSLPKLSKDEIKTLARNRYESNPGEFYARQAEQGLERTMKQIRDYQTRFGNMTLDELRAMMHYGISTP